MSKLSTSQIEAGGMGGGFNILDNVANWEFFLFEFFPMRTNNGLGEVAHFHLI